MLAETLLDLLHQAPEFHTLLEGLKKGYTEQLVYGLSGSMKSFLVAGLRRETGRPVLVVTSSTQQAERMREDLATWLPGQEALVFPPMEYVPFEVVARSPEVAGQRLAVLERLALGENLVVIAPAPALLRTLLPRRIFQAALTRVRLGGDLDVRSFAAALSRRGYERVEMVEAGGQFAVRGDILDVWPLTADSPLRIETEWDRIARLTRFDPVSQRSTAEVEEALVGPAREFILPEQVEDALGRIRQELEQTVARLQRRYEREVRQAREKAEEFLRGEGAERLRETFFKPEDLASRLRERVESHLERLAAGVDFEGSDLYAPYFYPEAATLLDYFARPPLVVVDEPARLREAATDLDRQGQERQITHLERGGLLPGQLGLYLSYEAFLGRLRRWQSIHLSLLLRKVQGLEPQHTVAVTGRPMQEFHGQWPLFTEELNRWRQQHYRVFAVASTTERQQRLKTALLDSGVPPALAEPQLSLDGNLGWPQPAPGQVSVAAGSLEAGFLWPGLRLAVVTDGEIYGRTKKRRRVQPSPAGREGMRLTSFQDLNVGDYVVHKAHGIGRYLGVQSETILGVTRDYIVIQYEGTDRLKIPTDQLDQIQKYIGTDGHEPRLSRLGGTEWSRVKARVKESIREMAAELLRIQAMRQAVPGHAFSPDTPWQREFEDAFPYEETPDQLRAAEEIKRDMEKPRPMDRLLLGDVGYGKTEVALRAAFKACADGKQVAFLVPTTILAQQHFATCTQRFAGFPIVVDVLNRFRTPREQQQVLERLARGEIDLIIGTHRLLSDDVRFKDLGLVIVDEEQRFGVQHKEKLKRLRAMVDVLTLSATPIPRTLHMALVGLRDISTIATPPEDRYPVETYVAEFDEALIRDAIERELARGGQVYFVHNRIQTIERVAARLRELVPEARFAVAHGQMKEEKLEQVMLDFLDREYDVLVATTIVESGLDIPNVNTIIVNDADHLGLAQLYQLRGRVGRSNRVAYAYFLYRKDKVLSEVAEKRLQAIKDFTELGSGFKIAMRDLEIRGAGNILGPEQHGFILSVGFDLYTQLLEETIRELKGEAPPPPEFQPTVELPVDAFLSDQYIADPRQKIEAYKRISAIRTLDEARDVYDELTDRFGSLPKPAANLLALARLRVLAADAGVTSIAQTRDRVHFKFLIEQGPDRDVIADLNRKYRGRLQLSVTRPPTLTLRAHGFMPEDVLYAAEDILTRLVERSPARV
ncbi:transcription-repair coupling factor [Caldinitratiruptor microaerophilus]|uniref:Transcription-repair-coupling factor n=1 Tax=Caldinitratiruptor microaerophilus TaxID=671077 RepID=A0AA35GB56_9FIRM|nr:transcription-repair coupling factor [Caldinitratiruptor microaerophilus]BDG62014.1 transcription-repair-coupling factor [Caldinitratiruptor microaerophilus]